MMIDYKYPAQGEQEMLMDLVIAESRKRGESYDNYNEQEPAYRQAISDGAMRLKVEL